MWFSADIKSMLNIEMYVIADCHFFYRTSISGNNYGSIYVNSWEKKGNTFDLEKSQWPKNIKGKGTIRG